MSVVPTASRLWASLCPALTPDGWCPHMNTQDLPPSDGDRLLRSPKLLYTPTACQRRWGVHSPHLGAGRHFHLWNNSHWELGYLAIYKLSLPWCLCCLSLLLWPEWGPRNRPGVEELGL